MKLQRNKLNYNGKDIVFATRPGTSDYKAYREVLMNDSYLQRGLDIKQGEDWLDIGANVGAFALVALLHGANVTSYEPDPISYNMIKMNLELNDHHYQNQNYTIFQQAVVGNDDKKAFLSISKTKQYWRNSLIKNWRGSFIEVECVNLNDIITDGVCIKMDNEGSEMQCIENLPNERIISKMAFEWSFDVDPSITRYRDAVAKVTGLFDTVKADTINAKHSLWKSNWFPPCKMVYCYNQESTIKQR